MMATCHRLGHLEYCDAIPAVIERFASALEQADPTARVPTCPDWTVAQLAEHVGQVHRWATHMVAALSPERVTRADMDFHMPADAGGLPDWIRSGGDGLADALRAGDPDAAMWAWGEDKHLRFWSRRMVFETLIHGIDLERALDREPEPDADIAVDGADEFLDNLPFAAYFAANVTELRGAGERLVFRATDAGVTWTVTLEPAGFTWGHADGVGEVVVEGMASDVLLLLWGRRKREEPRFTVSGERYLLALWVEKSPI